MIMRRMWINQPSTLQPNHKYHGARVLAGDPEPGRPATRVWFALGDIVSAEVLTASLSPAVHWPGSKGAPAYVQGAGHTCGLGAVGLDQCAACDKLRRGGI